MELARGTLGPRLDFGPLPKFGLPKLGGLIFPVIPGIAPMELCKKDGEGSPAGVKEGADDGGGGPAGVVEG